MRPTRWPGDEAPSPAPSLTQPGRLHHRETIGVLAGDRDFLAARMTWREMGACFETFNKDFFPPATFEKEYGPHVAARARAVCATCFVSEKCLDYALETRPQYGVWAGKTVRELRRM